MDRFHAILNRRRFAAESVVGRTRLTPKHVRLLPRARGAGPAGVPGRSARQRHRPRTTSGQAPLVVLRPVSVDAMTTRVAAMTIAVSQRVQSTYRGCRVATGQRVDETNRSAP